MKSVVLAICLVGVVSAASVPFRRARAPQQFAEQPFVAQPIQPQYTETLRAKPIAIISQSSDLQYDGNFNHNFEAENGISEETVGTIKVLDAEHQAQVMQGRYSYIAPDGTPIEARWYADEGGFHIEGAHLPTPPPVPEAIARSLEYIRSLPPSKEEGDYKQ